MAEFTHNRVQKNRKPVRYCDDCSRYIAPREEYGYWVGKVNGDFMTTGLCMKCHENWLEQQRVRDKKVNKQK